MGFFDRAQSALGVRTNDLVELRVCIGLRRVVQGNGPEAAVLVEGHGAEFGAANVGRVLQHFVENRFEFASR